MHLVVLQCLVMLNVKRQIYFPFSKMITKTTRKILKSSVSFQTLVFSSPNSVIRLFLYGSNSMHQQAKQSHGPPQGLLSYWVHRLLTHVQETHFLLFKCCIQNHWQVGTSALLLFSSGVFQVGVTILADRCSPVSVPLHLDYDQSGEKND